MADEKPKNPEYDFSVIAIDERTWDDWKVHNRRSMPTADSN